MSAGSSLWLAHALATVLLSTARSAAIDQKVSLVQADGNRRLSTASSSAAAIHITAVLDRQGHPVPFGEVASLLSNGGFAGDLQSYLQRPGAELPGLPGFVVGNPAGAKTWVLGSEGECSETCGQGVKLTEYQCSTGEEIDCVRAGIGPKPASESKECHDFSTCPFEPLCPLGRGRGGQLSCTAQAAMLLSGISLMVLSVLACCCLRVYRMSILKSEGRVQLTAGIWGTYRIVQSVKHTLSHKRRRSQEAIKDVSEQDSRTRIIWEVDPEALNQLFDGMGPADSSNSSTSAAATPEGEKTAISHGSSDYELPDDESGAEEELDDRIETILSMSQQILSARSGKSTTSAAWHGSDLEEPLRRGLRVDAGAGQRKVCIFPAFADGQRVEYLSATTARWLPGVIHVTVQTAGAGRVQRAPPSIRYDVELGRGQRRFHVSLQQLRAPLCQDEQVEVFSQRRGRFLPATMEGHQSAGATTVGYQVLLDGADAPLGGVSAAHLRRCFQPGQPIWVYRGLVRGWTTAVVCPERHAAGEDEEENEGARFVAALPQEDLPTLLGRAGCSDTPRTLSLFEPRRLVSRAQLPALVGPDAKSKLRDAPPVSQDGPSSAKAFADPVPPAAAAPPRRRARGAARSAVPPKDKGAAGGQQATSAPVPRGAWRDYPEASAAAAPAETTAPSAGAAGEKSSRGRKLPEPWQWVAICGVNGQQTPEQALEWFPTFLLRARDPTAGLISI